MFILWGSGFAYIDPGSGSFLIQLLVGGLLAVSFTLKSWRMKCLDALKRLFKGNTSRDTNPSDTDAEN